MQTREHIFKNCPEWKPQQKILWAEVRKETGEGEGPVQDPGPPCRRPVQPAGAGLPLHHGCGEAGPAPG
jgi:hypothetical protein